MMGLIAGIVIILGFAVLIVAVVLLRSFTRRQDTGPVADETRLVQDMYRTLDRLEKRVDVLETLLADQSPHFTSDWAHDGEPQQFHGTHSRRSGENNDPH